jgi:hypothetical protein
MKHLIRNSQQGFRRERFLKLPLPEIFKDGIVARDNGGSMTAI